VTAAIALLVRNRLDRIPKLGRFPLIVNPLVRTTRLTKAFMDGGSGLNLMYRNTFEGLGSLATSSRTAHTKALAFDVVDFSGPYHVILGGHVMSSS
jgi:hypothetical protein